MIQLLKNRSVFSVSKRELADFMRESQQQWNRFIMLVNQEQKEVVQEIEKIDIEIEKREKIEFLLKTSQNDIEFMILHKQSIITLDSIIAKKIEILEEFKKINNLSNAAALKTFKEILENERLNAFLAELQNLRNKRALLEEQFRDLRNIIIGSNSINIETILQICQKNNLPMDLVYGIATIAISKTSKREKNVNLNLGTRGNNESRNSNNMAQTSVEDQTSNTQNIIPTNVAREDEHVSDIILPTPEEHHVPHEETQTISIAPIEIIEEVPESSIVTHSEEETHISQQLQTNNYENLFNKCKKTYEEINNSSSILLNKYFIIIENLDEDVRKTLHSFAALSNNEFDEKIESETDQMIKAKVFALKIFTIKSEIKVCIEKIKSCDYSDIKLIDNLDKLITEYKQTIDLLKAVDKQVSAIKREKEEIKDPVVFFLTDENMKTFIPEIIKEQGFQGSLLSALQKAQDGKLQKRKDIVSLKIHDNKFKQLCNKTVYAVSNYKIVISFVKLDSDTDSKEDERIIILTASLIDDNEHGIVQDTTAVIKENREQLIALIKKLEAKDPQQLGLQSIVRDELMQEYGVGKGGRS